MDKPCVLYIDDERENLTGFKYMFSEYYEVYVAESAGEAYEILKAHTIPIVISDQRMPGETGVEFFTRIQPEYPDTIRMILTGYSDIKAVVDAINKGGIYYYFQKPWDETEVRIVIANALEAIELKHNLSESEERFRDICLNTYDWVWEVDRDGIYTYASGRIEELLGYKPEEIVGGTLFDWMPPEGAARIAEVFKDATGKGEPIVAMENVNLHKDGRRVVLETSCVPVFDAQGNVSGYRGVDRDITERKRGEEEREALRAQAQHNQRLESVGTLAGGVAHEINNPINGIMNYAQLIQDRLDEDSSLKEFASEIIVETKRVATIVRNLLTFARFEEHEHSPARMADIVGATASLIRTIIRRDQITLEVDVPEDLPTLRCRSQQIQQVIMNLMTNARDALNEHYPGYDENKILSVTAREIGRADSKWIRTTVEDHGVGIPAEVRERMFDPFFTTKDQGHGTGLGLSISHGIVRDHHGELSIESEPGEYTRFHLDLPVDSGWTLEEE